MQQIGKAAKWLGQRLLDAVLREGFRAFLDYVRDEWGRYMEWGSRLAQRPRSGLALTPTE